MAVLSRYRILTGPLAGQEHIAHGLNRRATPDGEVNSRLGDGIWIPALQVRVAADGQNHQATAYEDLIAPFDRFGNEIEVGDTLHASVAKQVRRVKVRALGKKYHQGCGWWTRKLRVEDIDSGKRTTLNTPSYTIKVS